MSYCREGSSIALVVLTGLHRLNSSSVTQIFYGDLSSHVPDWDREHFGRHSKPCSRFAAPPFLFDCTSVKLVLFFLLRLSPAHRTLMFSMASQQRQRMTLRKTCCAHACRSCMASLLDLISNHVCQ